MVQDAAALLDGKGWLPSRLRLPGVPATAETIAEGTNAPEPAGYEDSAPALPMAAE